jgi:hypothetical protein
MEKYLQQLLKEVNTIIIPGLGALTVTNHSTGELMFMPYLKYDDGKLSSYIAEQNGSSIEEAKDFISNRVEGIFNQLENEGVLKFSELGVFSKSSSGDIEFVSNEISELTNEEEVLEVENSISKEEVIISENTIDEDPILDVLTENEVFLEPSSIKEEVLEETSSDAKEEADEAIDKVKQLFSSILSKSETSFSSDSQEEIIEVDEPEEEYSVPTEEESIDFEEERGFDIAINSNLVNEEVISTNEDIAIETDITNLSEEKIIKNDELSIEIDEFTADLDVVNQSNKKKRGVKFWFFILLILVVLGGGTFVGINFEKFKHLIPFIAKTDSIEEQKIIEKLESDNTKPSTEIKTKSEEMLHPTDVTEENPSKLIEDEPVVTEIIDKPKLATHKATHKKNAKKHAKNLTTEVSVNDGSNKSFIIIGTFTEQVNAINLLDKIVAQGINSASILERNGNFSVCYSSFPTQEEAISKLSDAKSAFKSAWVFNKP